MEAGRPLTTSQVRALREPLKALLDMLDRATKPAVQPRCGPSDGVPAHAVARNGHERYPISSYAAMHRIRRPPGGFSGIGSGLTVAAKLMGLDMRPVPGLTGHAYPKELLDLYFGRSRGRLVIAKELARKKARPH